MCFRSYHPPDGIAAADNGRDIPDGAHGTRLVCGAKLTFLDLAEDQNLHR